jgi:hypothetical protein
MAWATGGESRRRGVPVVGGAGGISTNTRRDERANQSMIVHLLCIASSVLCVVYCVLCGATLRRQLARLQSEVTDVKRSREGQESKFRASKALALSRVDRFHLDANALRIIAQTYPPEQVGNRRSC